MSVTINFFVADVFFLSFFDKFEYLMVFDAGVESDIKRW